MAHCTSKRKNKKEQEILKAKYNKLKNCNPLILGIYFSEEKNRYIKSYKGARWTKLKRISHRIIRRSKIEKPTNKEFDLYWEHD